MDAHLRQLRCFVAVAEEQHFTRAAARLHLSQPALTRHIQALETTVRARLFTRGRYGAQLTRAGTALLPHARTALAAWTAGQTAVGQAVQTERHQLLVGLRSSIGRGLLARAAALFQQRHPNWTVQTRQHSFDDPYSGLLPSPGHNTTTDVALLWLPIPPHDTLACEILLSEPRLVALPSSTGPQRSFWLGEDLRHGHPVRIGAVVHGPEEVVEALAAGVGVAFISAGNAELHRSPVFVTRTVPGLPPAQLAVAWHREDVRPTVRDYVLACRAAATAPG